MILQHIVKIEKNENGQATFAEDSWTVANCALVSFDMV